MGKEKLDNSRTSPRKNRLNDLVNLEMTFGSVHMSDGYEERLGQYKYNQRLSEHEGETISVIKYNPAINQDTPNYKKGNN